MEIDWCQHHTEWTEGCKYCGPPECLGLKGFGHMRYTGLYESIENDPVLVEWMPTLSKVEVDDLLKKFRRR